jgi:hypothetical protein
MVMKLSSPGSGQWLSGLLTCSHSFHFCSCGFIAIVTLLSTKSEVLMAPASCRRSPEVPERRPSSEPARSIRFSLPTRTVLPSFVVICKRHHTFPGYQNIVDTSPEHISMMVPNKETMRTLPHPNVYFLYFFLIFFFFFFRICFFFFFFFLLSCPSRRA